MSPQAGVTAPAAWKRYARWTLTLAFFALIAWLIAQRAAVIDWKQVGQTLRDYPPITLAAAFALSLLSYLCCGSYDLLGRVYTKHKLGAGTVVGIAAVTYAFTMNLGAIVGGMGMRLRLYSRFGLPPATTAQVIGFAVLTNWSGYLLLAGLVFGLRPPSLPPEWGINGEWLRLLGIVLLAATLAYLSICVWNRRCSFTWRGREFTAPSTRLALLQLLSSSASWLLVVAVLNQLLPAEIAFTQIMAVLFVSSIAGIVTHIPAGIGVMEAVFVALLGHQADPARIVAALLAYRAVYYFLPLLLALPGYLALEWRGRRQPEAEKAAIAATVQEPPLPRLH